MFWVFFISDRFLNFTFKPLCVMLPENEFEPTQQKFYFILRQVLGDIWKSSNLRNG